MKLAILSAAAFQRQIAFAVEKFQRAVQFHCELNWKESASVHGRMARVLDLFKDGALLSYREIAERLLGTHADVAANRIVQGRLLILADRGFIEHVGNRWPSLYHKTKHGAKLYRLAERADPVWVVRARERLYRRVDDLTMRAVDIPACIGGRIGALDASRNSEWIRRRLGGETLTSIGGSFGVSRERVRQVVERAVRNQGVTRKRRTPRLGAREWKRTWRTPQCRAYYQHPGFRVWLANYEAWEWELKQ